MSERSDLGVHLRRPPEPGDLRVLEAGLDPRIRLTTAEECPDQARVEVLVDGRPGAEESLRVRDLAALLNAVARGETVPGRVDLDAGRQRGSAPARQVMS